MQKISPKKLFRILYGKKVSEIDDDSGSGVVLVKCEDGSEFSASSAAVVTVSLGCLKEGHEKMFKTPLPV